jgi:hypothetical protein
MLLAVTLRGNATANREADAGTDRRIPKRTFCVFHDPSSHRFASPLPQHQHAALFLVLASSPPPVWMLLGEFLAIPVLVYVGADGAVPVRRDDARHQRRLHASASGGTSP